MLLPDESAINARHIDTLNIDSLPNKARITCTFRGMTKSLLSILSARVEGDEKRSMKKESHLAYKDVTI